MIHGGSSQADRSDGTGVLRIQHSLYPTGSNTEMAVKARIGAWFVVLESVSIQRIQAFFADASRSAIEMVHVHEIQQMAKEQLQVRSSHVVEPANVRRVVRTNGLPLAYSHLHTHRRP
jgi:hypothetical protein